MRASIEHPAVIGVVVRQLLDSTTNPFLLVLLQVSRLEQE